MTSSARNCSRRGSSDDEVAMITYNGRRQEFVHRELEIFAKKLPNSNMELVEMKGWHDWDCVLNLSESNYPVKIQEELVTFLSSNKECETVYENKCRTMSETECSTTNKRKCKTEYSTVRETVHKKIARI